MLEILLQRLWENNQLYYHTAKAAFNTGSCFFIKRPFCSNSGFCAIHLKSYLCKKFWFPVYWNEKGIGCNSRTVPATVNRNKSFCFEPLCNNGKVQKAKVRRPARMIIKI
ncbi:hypothetical protein HX13_04475 [Chryseobacterium sp. P1-3]|nr:hypothetical protein HX13_04475 [Chryseobacterium sp. P1-3]